VIRSSEGAGIGSGYVFTKGHSQVQSVRISVGTITAISDYGAGIGTGRSESRGRSGTTGIHISGGKSHAEVVAGGGSVIDTGYAVNDGCLLLSHISITGGKSTPRVSRVLALAVATVRVRTRQLMRL
jgi:hypothetical protein